MSQINIEWLAQSNDSTCGPAVIRMLLNYYHIRVSEEEIVQASESNAMLKDNGTRIDHLAKSVSTFSHDLEFYFKEDASIEDIQKLIHEHHIPVGVNWQGMFWDSLLEESRLSSNIYHGHYSIVTNIDTNEGVITLLDPYSQFKGLRHFSIDWFKSRWWDISDTYGSEIKEDISYYTSRLIFAVVPKKHQIVKQFGMNTVPENYFIEKIEKAKKSLPYHPAFEPKGIRFRLLTLFVDINRKVLSLVNF